MGTHCVTPIRKSLQANIDRVAPLADCLTLACLRLVFVGLLVGLPSFPCLAQTNSPRKQTIAQLASEARTEGRVVVWGPPGEAIRKAMTEGFKRAFPDIGIEYSGARGGEQATRIKAERDGGVYSVDVMLSGTTTAINQMKPVKALDPIMPVLVLPEVTDPKKWRGGKLEFSDETTRLNLVFSTMVKAPLVYNPKLAKPGEIDELPKLLDPKWKGKFVINDPLPSGSGNVTFRWIWQVMGPEKAKDYYRRIRANVAVADRDQRRQIEWVAQGKYAFLLAPSDGTLGQLIARGLKLGILPEFKDYGTYVTASFGSAMLLNRRPHPSAAAVFLNWLLTREGQTAWSKAMEHVSRRLDVPTDHLPPYIIPPPDAKFFSAERKPGYRYWLSYTEENVQRSAEETKILTELFGR
ncbi:MAG: ABC transporter substrate-binding protein [Alphaproteobacteria bacterium]